MLPDWLLILLTVLVTFRLTVLVTRDRITRVPRERLQGWAESRWERRTGRTSDTDEWQSEIAYLLSCPWCVSIWVGGATVLAVGLTHDLPAPILVWLAASGVTGLLAEVTDD